MDFLYSRTKQQHYSIWIRDCKPDTLSEIVGNSEIVETLKMYVRTGNLPNILLTGPNGTGKKNMVELAVKEYLGSNFERGCLRIDGSIYRGKDIITNTNDYGKKNTTDKVACDTPNVMKFAKTKVTMDGGKKKVVIIYNFDHMTSEAQNAMRRIIELYAKSTRFILVCNDIEEIIEAIQSRCIPLRTAPVTDIEMSDLLCRVLVKNQVPENHVKQDVIDTICVMSGGDIKKAINYLQVISGAEVPSVDTFFKIFNIPPIHNIKLIIDSAQNPETYQVAYDTLDKLLENGYDAADILGIFINTVARYETLPLKTRVAYLHAISRCYIKTELMASNSHLFSLIARLGRIAIEGYTADPL